MNRPCWGIRSPSWLSLVSDAAPSILVGPQISRWVIAGDPPIFDSSLMNGLRRPRWYHSLISVPDLNSSGIWSDWILTWLKLGLKITPNPFELSVWTYCSWSILFGVEPFSYERTSLYSGDESGNKHTTRVVDARSEKICSRGSAFSLFQNLESGFFYQIKEQD